MGRWPAQFGARIESSFAFGARRMLMCCGELAPSCALSQQEVRRAGHWRQLACSKELATSSPAGARCATSERRGGDERRRLARPARAPRSPGGATGGERVARTSGDHLSWRRSHSERRQFELLNWFVFARRVVELRRGSSVWLCAARHWAPPESAAQTGGAQMCHSRAAPLRPEMRPQLAGDTGAAVGVGQSAGAP